MKSPESGHGDPTEIPVQKNIEASTDVPQAEGRREHELRNLEYIDEIMVGDDPALQKELKEFLVQNGLSEEKIARSFESRRLRHDVHEKMMKEQERRLATSPAPSDVELLLGVYLEEIEPQVREAVVALTKKGYPTRGSGFDSFNTQSIYLDLGRADFSSVSPEKLKELESMGVTLDKSGRKLSFDCDEVDIEKIKTKWDEIAAALPDLGIPSVEHGPYNLTFAKNAKKYRGKSYPQYEKYYDQE